ncbi:MAG: enhanced entry protein EnhB [Legionellaceae bacterium]|nr:enhanced entry protein EnhB [Legionellaceae bacterium]
MSFYRKLATVLISMSSIALTGPTHAANLFPRGCEVTGFGFSKNYLIVNEHGDQTFYLIQNHSDKQIEIEHYETQTDVFMSPKLESKLAPGHWSAFASDVANLYFQCIVQNGTERQVINCSDVLDVCQYPRVKFALSNMGNYWVSTDKPQAQVIKDATAKGIFLHW